MFESHTGGFHRPVQTLVDTFISFRVPRKRKEMHANPSFFANLIPWFRYEIKDFLFLSGLFIHKLLSCNLRHPCFPTCFPTYRFGKSFFACSARSHQHVPVCCVSTAELILCVILRSVWFCFCPVFFFGIVSKALTIKYGPYKAKKGRPRPTGRGYPCMYYITSTVHSQPQLWFTLWVIPIKVILAPTVFACQRKTVMAAKAIKTPRRIFLFISYPPWFLVTKPRW